MQQLTGAGHSGHENLDTKMFVSNWRGAENNAQRRTLTVLPAVIISKKASRLIFEDVEFLDV